MKKYGSLLVLGMLMAGGALVMLGEKSKGRVGLDAVMEVATDASHDLDRVGFGLTRVSDAEEMELGREIAMHSSGWWGSANSDLDSYVKSLGRILAMRVRRTGITYSFHVLDSPDVNAFALPGGQIFILRGLVEFAGSESELAMIIGHEIAHVDLRHCIELFQHELLIKKIAGSSPTNLIGGMRYLLVKGLGTMALLVHRIITQGYRQFQEFDADAQGWSYATAAGYDPEAAVRIMAKLSDRFGNLEQQPVSNRSPIGEIAGVIVSAPGSYLRSHPPTIDRIKAFKKILEDRQSDLTGRSFYVGAENLKKLRTRRQLPLPAEERPFSGNR